MMKMTNNMLWWCSADEVVGFACKDGQIGNMCSDTSFTQNPT